MLTHLYFNIRTLNITMLEPSLLGFAPYSHFFQFLSEDFLEDLY